MVPEVTAFLPFGPERIVGRKAVEETFREVFAEMRREVPGPPYLRLEPQRFTIQVEAMMAVVSFELPHEGAMGRRTLVLAKQDQGWRIIHIHASEHIAV